MLAHARKGRHQVAKHVRRAPVVLMLVRSVRVVVSGRRRDLARLVGVAEEKDVMAVRRLPGGRLPAEGRRQNRREEYADEDGSDGTESATHGEILTQAG